MPRYCDTCGRTRHSGLCDLALLSDGRLVHVGRIDHEDGDVRQEIEAGKVKVTNRWIKQRKQREDT